MSWPVGGRVAILQEQEPANWSSFVGANAFWSKSWLLASFITERAATSAHFVFGTYWEHLSPHGPLLGPLSSFPCESAKPWRPFTTRKFGSGPCRLRCWADAVFACTNPSRTSDEGAPLNPLVKAPARTGAVAASTVPGDGAIRRYLVRGCTQCYLRM